MITYKKFNYMGNESSINKYIDNVFVFSIPFDEANTDYQAYLKWLDEGNTPEPADEPTSE